MFESILNSSVSTLNIGSSILCMIASVVLGSVVAFVHTIDNKYSKKFILALILLPLLVQVVIIMVNGNLGTSVAILGAFSLIRFRSMPGNSRELVSVFFSMAIGLATGIGHVLFAAVFTIIIAITIVIITKLNIGENKNIRYLKIIIPEDLDYESLFDDVFSLYTKRASITKTKTINMGSLYELDYEVDLKENISHKKFLDDIRIKNGNLKVVLSTPVLECNEL